MPEEKVFPSDSADEAYPEPSKKNLDPTCQELRNPDSIEQAKQSRKKALLQFRCRVEDAIISNYILEDTKGKITSNPKENLNPRDITLWGVPLQPSKGHEGTDIVLLKFLRSKDFKVSEAFNMLRRTLKWRKEFDVEGIADEKLDSGLENLSSVDGEDKLGRPVCYEQFGALKNREFYNKTFGTQKKHEEFVRWKIQSMEKGIQKLRFRPGGANSILQVTDLKNSPGPAMKELRSLNKKTLALFQEKYPDLIFRNIYINVPFWDFVSHSLQSQNSNSKFVFARPARVTQTLLKYIAPENIPVQYGGLKREIDDEFSPNDKVVSLSVRGGAEQIIRIPVAETGVTVVWDVAVVGYEVNYKEEFIPDDDCSYNVLLQVEKKMRESVRNSFYIYEPGKIVITIHNGTTKKKKIFFRHKTKPTLPLYILK
ncbi:hypothetical protein U1Q18_043091 [Sarracenia purpurea var. burkii]